jgi:hypothetical protein
MKYAVKMGSAALMYITFFIRISLDIQKLIGGDKDSTEIA